MKRILLIGNAPLPSENTKSRPAAGLRTYQFLKPLIKGGVSISNADHAFSSIHRPRFAVSAVNIAMPECYNEEPGRKEMRHSEHYSEYVISKNDPGLVPFIQGIHDEFHPDAMIGVNTFPSYIATRLNSSVPFWADLNGWFMAEAQAQAYKMGSNDFIPHYHDMERAIMLNADRVSAVSNAQKYALLGELASLGRLTKETFGRNFVHHIPNGTEWFDGEAGEFSDDAGLLADVPTGAFCVLWMGGYNTWVDEVTLFNGVSDAMARCDKLHFVSTGGGIAGLDNKTFAKFKELIDASEYSSRFLFLGWVNTQDIPVIYGRSDIGLNVDRNCIETSTGARNRINEMMKFGLPVVSTLGSEISYEMARAGAGWGVKSGDHEGLTTAICGMYELWRGGGGLQSREFRDFGKNGMKYIEEECNYDAVLRPLIKWLENPRPSEDRGVNVFSGGRVARSLRTGLRYLRENGVKKFLGKVRGRI